MYPAWQLILVSLRLGSLFSLLPGIWYYDRLACAICFWLRGERKFYTQSFSTSLAGLPLVTPWTFVWALDAVGFCCFWLGWGICSSSPATVIFKVSLRCHFIFWRLGYRSGSAWTKKKNLKPDQQCGTRHWSRGPQPQPQQTWGRFHRWSEPSYSKKSKILFFWVKIIGYQLLLE